MFLEALQTTFSLSFGQAELVCNLFERQLHSRKDLIQSGFDGHSDLYFLESGYIRIFTVLDSGKEVTQWIATPGYFTADISSFFYHQAQRWTFQCLTDVAVYVISRKQYDQLAFLIPDWLKMEQRFLLHCMQIMEQRLFSHLAMTAEERYQQFSAQFGFLFNEVPHQYLASILGMTPETLSRIRTLKL